MEITKATINDIDEIAQLYDDLNDYLESTTNWPGWAKGIYPIRRDAEAGFADDGLFVLKINGKIAGSIALSNR